LKTFLSTLSSGRSVLAKFGADAPLWSGFIGGFPGKTSSTAIGAPIRWRPVRHQLHQSSAHLVGPELTKKLARSSVVVHNPLTTGCPQLIIKMALEFAAKLPLRGEDDSYQGILWRDHYPPITTPPEIPATF
jgi:hypothetical protein